MRVTFLGGCGWIIYKFKGTEQLLGKARIGVEHAAKGVEDFGGGLQLWLGSLGGEG